MADAFVGTWISWLNINKVSRQVLTFSQWARLSHEKIHNFIWPEILNEFRAISKRKYDGSDDWENKKIQIKLIKDMLRWLLSWFLTNHWSSPNLLKSYNSSTWPFSQLNNWWIDMMEFKNKKVNDSSLEDWSSIEWEKLLNRFSEQLLEHELTWRNFSSEVWQWIKNVRDAVWGTLDTENI